MYIRKHKPISKTYSNRKYKYYIFKEEDHYAPKCPKKWKKVQKLWLRPQKQMNYKLYTEKKSLIKKK